MQNTSFVGWSSESSVHGMGRGSCFFIIAEGSWAFCFKPLALNWGAWGGAVG